MGTLLALSIALGFGIAFMLGVMVGFKKSDMLITRQDRRKASIKELNENYDMIIKSRKAAGLP